MVNTHQIDIKKNSKNEVARPLQTSFKKNSTLKIATPNKIKARDSKDKKSNFICVTPLPSKKSKNMSTK